MDKISKQILNQVKAAEDQTIHYYVDEIPFSSIADENVTQAAIKYLVDNEFLNELIRGTTVIGVTLSHKSIHSKYFAFETLLEYLLKNWIAIIALFLSIASLAMQLWQ